MEYDLNENSPLSIEDLHFDSDTPKQSYLCRNFKIFPEHKEKAGGYIFGIIEIKATPLDEAERIFQTILNALKDGYYQQIISSPDPKKLNIETIFEFALNKTNNTITELIEIGQIKLIKQNLHFFIGLAKPNKNKGTDIYFTNSGMIKAFLIHRAKNNEYKSINIIEAVAEPPGSNSKIKIFSAITSGQLANDDILVVCTEIFNNYISVHKIKHILQNNPLPQSMAYFKSQIKNITAQSALTHSLIVIKKEEKTASSHIPLAHKSIDNFINTTEQTEKLLTPSFAINIKKNLLNIFSALKKIFNQKKSRGFRSLSSSREKSNDISTGQSQPPPPNNLFIKLTRNVFLILTGRKKLTGRNVTRSIQNLKEKPQKAFSTVSNMHQYSKFIILIIIIIIGGIWFSVSWAKKQSALKQEQEVYAQQVEKVRNLLSEAEVSFIYKNKNKSLGQIQSAATELKYLPQATEVQQTNHRELLDQMENLKNKLLNIEKIIPQFVLDLEINGQTVPSSNLIISSNNLYSYGINNSIFIINITDKKIEQIIDSEEQISLGAVEKGNTYFISKSGQVYYLADNRLDNTGLQIPNSFQSVKAYNDSLYFLDKDKQQISKYQKTNGVFGTPIAWIKQLGSANLTTARSLAIDGSIYILNDNGQINKFHAGEYEAFNNPIIEPAMTQAVKVITSPEINDLYLFEATSKRLLIMNKTGNVIRQLIFDSVPETTDVAISADAQTGFLLVKDKIYQFSL